MLFRQPLFIFFFRSLDAQSKLRDVTRSLKDISSTLQQKTAKLNEDWKLLSSQSFYVEAWKNGDFDLVKLEMEEIQGKHTARYEVAKAFLLSMKMFDDKFYSMPQFVQISRKSPLPFVDFSFSFELSDDFLKVLWLSIAIPGFLIIVSQKLSSSPSTIMSLIGHLSIPMALFFFLIGQFRLNLNFPTITKEWEMVHFHINELTDDATETPFGQSRGLMETLQKKMDLADSRTMLQILKSTTEEVQHLETFEKKVNEQASTLSTDRVFNIKTEIEKAGKNNWIVHDDYNDLKKLVGRLEASVTKVLKQLQRSADHKERLRRVQKILPKLQDALKEGNLYQGIAVTKEIQNEAKKIHEILEGLYEKVIEAHNVGLELMEGIQDAGGSSVSTSLALAPPPPLIICG